MTAEAQVVPPEYRVTDLGTINNDDSEVYSIAYAINLHGQVVGASLVDLDPHPEHTDYRMHAFLYLPNAIDDPGMTQTVYGLLPGMHDLHEIGGASSPSEAEAYDINDWGHIVGAVSSTTPDSAFLWLAAAWTHGLPNVPEQEFRLLPSRGSGELAHATANGISNSIVPWRIFGTSYNDVLPDEWAIAVWWYPVHVNTNTPPSYLGFPFPAYEPWQNSTGHAVAVNTAVQPSIVHYAGQFRRTAEFIEAQCDLPDANGAAAWTGSGGRFDLDDDLFGNSESSALDVSINGEFVGWARDAIDPEPESDASCLKRAAYWATATSTPENLHLAIFPPEEVFHETEANAIRSNELEIVGAVTTARLATIWTHGGGLLWDGEYLDDLSNIPPTAPPSLTPFGPFDQLWQAHGINENGWIVGVGDVHNSTYGDLHAFLLMPTTPCDADMELPMGVEQQDLNRLLNRWGDPTIYTPGEICWEDLDGQNGVGQADLNILLNNWGNPDCLPGGERVGGGGTGLLSEDQVQLWIDLGGADRLLNGQITGADVAAALNHANPNDAVSSFFLLLSEAEVE